MVDANAKIRVDLDLAEALAQLKTLERQIQYFNKSIIQGSSEASRLQNEFNTSLIHNINATGKFTASMGKVHTETERFTNALEKNKLSAREYFRYSMASTKTFGRLFGKEFGTITKVAEERVKLLQSRHIELGRAADGAMRSVKVVPNSLDYSKPITQLQIAAQKQQIFNKLLDAGTTKLLNFGKNTQWAGRQLMVGFTIPLSILGATALRTFKDMETQAIRFRKVYGDIFTSSAETDQALENVKKLANEFTKYGVAVADTIKLAADAAAAGNSGAQLENVIKQATKLSVLGGVAQEQALDATIAIQNAFGLTGKALDDSINFLNAVENQTIVALDDITQAIPKVAPVVKQLGGDIKDLAFFMAAMQEGGVNASEAANALKSGLASLINPSKAASKMAAELGINLNGIVEANAGDLRATVMTFAEALQPLDDLAKSRLIEQIFGKYQFARLSTLFENITKSGNQASRVLKLTAASTEELAIMAERELGITADSAAVKFAASMEKLKAALVPLGEQFAKTVTPIAEFLTKVLQKFDGLSDGVKNAISRIILIVGGVGPVLLMTIGLVANGIANIAKGINLLRKGYQNIALGGKEAALSSQYLSTEQLEALAVANNLHNAHQSLTNQYALEANALLRLTSVYQQATSAAGMFASSTPGLFVPGSSKRISRFGKPMAEGGWVPGTGNKDTVPAVLMPGEFVVKKDVAQRNSQTLESMNKGGQVYRGAGTPLFGNKIALRGEGTFRAQTASLHFFDVEDMKAIDPIDPNIQFFTEKGGVQGRLYGGYSMWGSNAFNQLVTKGDHVATIKGLLGGGTSAFPMHRSEAENIFNYLTDLERKGMFSENMRVAKKELEWNLNRYPSENEWRTNAAERIALADLDARGIYPDNPRYSKMYSALTKKYSSLILNGTSTRDSALNIVRFANDRNQRALALGIPIEKGMKGYKTGQGRPGEYAGGVSQRGMPLVKQLGLKQTDPRFGIIGGKGIQYNPEWNSGQQAQLAQSTNITPTTNYSRKKTSWTWGSTPRRASGTPSYGEQGVTPALLTPGEFVVNSQSTQKYGPALQAMNQGLIENRDDGTEWINNVPPKPNPLPDDVWEDMSSTQSSKPDKFTKKLRSTIDVALDKAEKGIVKAAKTTIDKATPALDAWTAEHMSGYTKEEARVIKEISRQEMDMKKQGATIEQIEEATRSKRQKLFELEQKSLGIKLDSMQQTENMIQDDIAQTQTSTSLSKKEQKKLERQKKRELRQQKTQRLMGYSGTASMLGFAVSGGLMAAQNVEGSVGNFAKAAAPAAIALSTVAGFLPLLANPWFALIAAGTSVATSLLLLNKSVDDARKNGYKLGKTMGNTEEELKKMGEMTGNVSASEVALRQRSERIKPINPLQSDFGREFIGSDLGKSMLDEVKKITDSGQLPAEVIGTKLADYVSQGLLDAAQAQSIAEEIGRQFKSETLSLKINGELQKLIGVNGRDMLKDPLEVRVRLVEDARENLQDFIDTVPTQLENIKSGSIVTKGLIDWDAFGKEWSRFMKTGKADLAQLGDFFFTFLTPITPILGQFLNIQSFKDRQGMAKVAGQQAGLTSFAIETSQKSLDAFNIQMEKKKLEYEQSQKQLEAELQITKNAEKRIQIETRLKDLKAAQTKLDEQTKTGQQKLLQQQAQTVAMVRESFANAGELQGDMLTASSNAVTEKYKDTPLASIASLLTGQTSKFKNQELTFTINTLAGSGLDLQNSLALAGMFIDPTTGEPNEQMLETQMSMMIDAHGIEGLNRALTATSEITDRFTRGKMVQHLKDLDTEAFDSANSFLEMATSLDDLDVNMTNLTLNMNEDKREQFVEAGEDLKKIDETFPDKITKEALLEFSDTDSDLAGMKSNIDWFESLPDEQTKLAVQVYRTIFETMDLEDIEKKMNEKRKQDASVMGGSGKYTAATQEEVMTEAVSRTMTTLKKYFGPDGIFSKQFDEATQGGDGSQSLPINTAQLIELRMKGLDPAAASQLDAASAAKILNGTVTQQKNAIKNLNDELRNNAIRSELLKSDQEVLQDTLEATSASIDAYINSLENTDIKPIQDTIDSYEELTKKQQNQIDLFQRGLQQLSDKEENINSLYEKRIQAIDKVTQANERAAQSQQRNIDLATALSSGDIAAAASAAAEITTAGAQAQLEDTRSLLEQQRQAEIASLTTEINNQLYTREQIEINIKTIEEDIYQRSLLIKTEQEKIANIEKTITAEKEKQRKLQVLSQISALSERIGTTVNQTARQAMSSQIGYLGQSIGIDATNQSQVNTLASSLGIDLTGFSDLIAKSHETAQMTADEFTKTFLDVKKKVKDVSKYMDEGSLEARNSLGFLKGLSSTWKGTTKVAGLESTGRDVLNSLSAAAGAIRTGKEQIQNAVNAGVAAVKSAKPTLKYDPKTGKMVPAAFGGMMGKGKLAGYMYGGNVNYKGSTEPAPVRMAMGSIVPGMGNVDRIPALLTPGEFVVRKSVAQENMGLLKSLNGDVFPQLNSLGAPAVDASSTNIKSNILNNSPVYNYSVNVNVPNTNASPDEIANAVITKINRYQNNKVRGSRV